MRIAEELDYTPAAAARTLVTQRSHVVGVFLETGEGHPDLQHPFFHEVLGGFKQFAGAAGYDLLMFASERPGNGYGTHSYLKRCRHHNVDGAVLMGMDAEDPEVRRLVRSDVATVGVDLELEGPLTTSVASDNEAGSAAAVRHLHELGHRRIAHITGHARQAPGRRPPARLPPRAAAPRRHPARRVRHLRRLLRRDRLHRACRRCSRSTSRRPRSSPPPT